jgi:hypothetical protein
VRKKESKEARQKHRQDSTQELLLSFSDVIKIPNKIETLIKKQ